MLRSQKIDFFYPLMPIVAFMQRSAKILILILRRGSSKKFSMSVTTLSRETKRAFLRLSPENLRIRNSGTNGLRKIHVQLSVSTVMFCKQFLVYT